MNDSLNPGSRPRRGAAAVIGATVSAVLLTSILVLGNAAEVEASGLARFTSCETLSAWGAKTRGQMRFQAVGAAIDDSSAGIASTTGPTRQEAAVPTAAGGPADQATLAPDGDRDGTNVVVEGIDEPDMVERLGGDRALVVGGSVLAVVDLAAGMVESRASVPPGAQVTYDAEAGVAWAVGDSPEGGVVALRFVVTGNALTADGEWSTAGNLVSARRDGSELLVVATDGFSDPGNKLGPVGFEIDPGEVEPVSSFPARPVDDSSSSVPFAGGPVPCDQVLHPAGPSEPTATLLVVLPATGALTPVRATEVVGAGHLIHVTHDAAYLATPQWDEQSGAQSTGLHRFDLASLTHTGSGLVTGSMLNDFSLSEHDGFLRVAVTTEPGSVGRPVPVTEIGPGSGALVETTDPDIAMAPSPTTPRPDDPMPDEPLSMPTVVEPPSGGEALNEVVVLDTVGDLDVVGRTARFGHPRETLRGVRFDGDVAYGVTFLTTDPFYVLDLTDPTAPRVQGEVELPGFSSYLHPISAEYVVGFGPDEQGRAAVKLFDVSDRSQPRVADTVALGDESPVTSDHHAFVSLDSNRFAVPASDWTMRGGGCDPASCAPTPPCDPAACDSISPPRPSESKGIGSSVVVLAVSGGRLVVEERHSVVLDEAASRVIPTNGGWGLLTSGAVTLLDNAGQERATVPLADG